MSGNKDCCGCSFSNDLNGVEEIFFSIVLLLLLLLGEVEVNRCEELRSTERRIAKGGIAVVAVLAAASIECCAFRRGEDNDEWWLRSLGDNGVCR